MRRIWDSHKRPLEEGGRHAVEACDEGMIAARDNWPGHRKAKDQNDEDVVNLANKDYGQAAWNTMNAKHGNFARHGAVQTEH